MYGYNRPKGHVAGKENLKNVLEWCYEMGVEYVTVYAFSMENFAHSEWEVDTVLTLLRDRLIEAADSEKVDKREVKTKVIDDKAMLPDEGWSAIEYAESKTRDYDNRVFTVAFIPQVLYSGYSDAVHRFSVY